MDHFFCVIELQTSTVVRFFWPTRNVSCMGHYRIDRYLSHDGS